MGQKTGDSYFSPSDESAESAEEDNGNEPEEQQHSIEEEHDQDSSRNGLNSEERNSRIERINAFFDTFIRTYAPNYYDVFSSDKYFNFLVWHFANMTEDDEIFRRVDSCLEQIALDYAEYPDQYEVYRDLLLQFEKYVCSSGILRFLNVAENESSLKLPECNEEVFSNMKECDVLAAEGSDINNQNGGTSEADDIYRGSTEYLNEIKELKFQYQLRVEENSRLTEQVMGLEELHQQISQENKKLVSKICHLQSHCEKLSLSEKTEEERTERLNFLESMQLFMKDKLMKLEKQNSEFEEKVKNAERQLYISTLAVERSKRIISDRNKLLSEERKLTRDLHQEVVRIQSLYDEECFKRMNREADVKELADANIILRHDCNEKEKHLLKIKQVLNRMLSKQNGNDLNMEDCSEHITEDLFEGHSVLETLNFFMTCSSSKSSATSFCCKCNCSIQAEIGDKVLSSEGLSSPFCGKENVSLVDNSPNADCSSPKKKLSTFSTQKYYTADDENSDSTINAESKVDLKLLKHELQSQVNYIKMTNDRMEEVFKEKFDYMPPNHQLTESGDELLKLKTGDQVSGDLILPEQMLNAKEFTIAENRLVAGFSASDIKEQINTEIKALRAQLVRSHALLTFLQMKEKVPYKTSTPDSLKEKSRAYQIKNDLFPQRSFDGQFGTHFHVSRMRNSSNASCRWSPYPKVLHTQSCPILVSKPSVISQCTQTDVNEKNDSDLVNVETEPLMKEVISHRYLSVYNRTKEKKVNEFSSASEISSESVQNLFCGQCEIYSFTEESQSPQFPRHRTNSFLAAVNSSKTNLINTVDENVNGSVDNQSPVQPALLKDSSEPDTSSNNRAVKIVDHQQSSRLKVSNPNNATTPEKETFKSCATSSLRSDDKNRKSEKEKIIKTCQRSMRRGSGAGSPNSLSSIPRYPAFDFSEQEDEHSICDTAREHDIPHSKKPEALQKLHASEDISGVVSLHTKSPEFSQKDPSQKKQESSKSMMLMPETVENSETESAKGSFEYEPAEASLNSEQPPPLPVPDTAFPNLPNSLLYHLGVSKDSMLPVDSFSETELESKFMSLALAFKTDKMTLTKRLELHKHQRDVTEMDVESELIKLKRSLQDLHSKATNSETRDLISQIQNHVDIICQAASKISARAETYGAVKQEEKVSRAFEVMILHVENLKRMFDREHKELEETKRMLSGTQAFRKEFKDVTLEERKKSLKTFGIAVGSIKSGVERSASVADLHQHLFSESLPPASFSRSWSSGFKEKKIHPISILSPSSSSYSIGMNSSSSSAFTRTSVVQPYSQPCNKDQDGRRCSLPVSSLKLSSSSVSSISRNVEMCKSETLCSARGPGELKISMAPLLCSVVDEKEHSEADESDDIESESRKPETSPNSDMSKFKWNLKDFSSEKKEMVCENTDIDVASSVIVEGSPQCFAALPFPSVMHFWKTTSSATLIRYILSFVCGVSALVIFIITFYDTDEVKP